MTLIKIKNLLSVILLICVWLPLSQCEMIKQQASPLPPDGSRQVESIKTEVRDFVPMKEVDFNRAKSLIFIFPFLWPLLFTLFQKRIHAIWFKYVFTMLELLLIGFSIYAIVVWVFLIGRPLIGGYIAIISIALYLAIFLAEHLVPLARKRDYNHSGLIRQAGYKNDGLEEKD